MNRTLQIFVAAVFCVIACLVLLVGTYLSFATSSAGCTLATGRSIQVTSTGISLSVESSKDTALINAAGHKVIVAPNFVDVDDQQIVEIDPAAKNIEITVARREVSIVGDGKSYGTVK